MLRNEIVVVSPSPNASFEQGKSTSICWACNQAEARLTILLQGDREQEIAKDVPNYGVYSWTPLGLPSGNYYIVIKSDTAEGCSGTFQLRESKLSIAMVERLLDSPTLPPFTQLKATRHFTYGALAEQQKRVQRPKTAKPCKVLARTNGPQVNLTASEVRRCLHLMLNEPNITVDQVLPNGDTVGQFSVKYILMHAQRREIKREKELS